jgi:heptosyltransferase-2
MRRLSRRPLPRYRYVRLRWRVVFTIVDFLGHGLFATAAAVRRFCALGWACLARTPTCPPAAAPRDGMPPNPNRNQAAFSPADPQVILLVQLDHLGDAILSTAMLAALRRRWPRASIEVLASPWNREVFAGVAEVDRVYVSRVNRFARGLHLPLAWIVATLWWGLWLRRRRIDVAIDVRGEFPLALMLWLSGARRRLGWNCGGGGFLLTDSAEFVPGRPETDSRFALLARLGIEPLQTPEATRPRFDPGAAARRNIQERLAALDSTGQRPPLRIVAHVGAGTPAKQWPLEHWQELIVRLTRDYAAQVVLVGGAGERAIAQGIAESGPARSFGDRLAVVDWTGRLCLAELGALIEECDLLVGADSGPAHLAAAVGGRVAVLWSGTNDPRQWQPYGKRVRVIRQEVSCQPCHRQACPWADHPCMNGVRPERVLAAVARLLSETSWHGGDAREYGVRFKMERITTLRKSPLLSQASVLKGVGS